MGDKRESNGRQWETEGIHRRHTGLMRVETSERQTLNGRKSYILETVGNRILSLRKINYWRASTDDFLETATN